MFTFVLCCLILYDHVIPASITFHMFLLVSSTCWCWRWSCESVCHAQWIWFIVDVVDSYVIPLMIMLISCSCILSWLNIFAFKFNRIKLNLNNCWLSHGATEPGFSSATTFAFYGKALMRCYCRACRRCLQWGKVMGVRYPGPVSRHNLVCPLLLYPDCPRLGPFCHDGGRWYLW